MRTARRRKSPQHSRSRNPQGLGFWGLESSSPCCGIIGHWLISLRFRVGFMLLRLLHPVVAFEVGFPA